MPGLTEMPSLQEIMADQRRQKIFSGLTAAGLSLMGGAQPMQGLMAGLSQMQPDPMGGLQTYALQQRIQDSQRERELEDQQQTARAALLGGHDPSTGIDWNQGRQWTGATSPAEPGGLVDPGAAQQAGLLGQAHTPGLASQAFPAAMDAQAVKALFPEPMKASDLVEVQTPEGPKLMRASDAEGRRPYDKPESLQLKEIYDPESPTGTRLVRESEAIGKAGKPSSSLMQITGYDEAGRPLIQIGGRGPQIEKKTKGDLEAKLLDTTDALARLDNIATSFKPEYQTLATRGEEWFANLKEKTGLGDVSPEDRALIEDYTIYQSTGLDNINRTIKEMTGAQMSEAEAKRLRAAAPDPGEGVWPKQGPTKFIGQIKRVNRDLRAAQARYAYALRNGLTTNPEALSKQIPLDQMEAIIQQRAEEIEASLPPGTPPEDALGIVAARVAREFALPFGGQ